MGRVKDTIIDQEDATYPPDHLQASIEFELAEVIKSAAHHTHWNEIEMQEYCSTVIKQVFDDMQDNAQDYWNVPFQEVNMDAILEWLNQRPEGCKVLAVKSYEALGEVVITLKQEEGKTDE